jgi:hypothetical protein
VLTVMFAPATPAVAADIPDTIRSGPTLNEADLLLLVSLRSTIALAPSARAIT